MRTALFLAAALTTAAVPFGSAHAKPKGPSGLKGKKGPSKGKKGKKGQKGKKGKKGKGGSSGGSGSGGSGGSSSDDDPITLPNGVSALLRGAGQRLSFTFAGKIWTRNGNTNGNFFLAFHPQSPGTAIVHVSCRYNEFSDVSISPTQSSFRMEGRCRQVFDDGRMETVAATNDVIINNAETDSISIVTVGGGLSVPPGALSFGDFDMTSAGGGAS